MQFHVWQTTQKASGVSSKNREQFLAHFEGLPLPPDMRVKIQAEFNWQNCGRPYYRMYPVASEAIAKLRLDLPWEHIRLPVKELLMQFPVGREFPVGDGRAVRSALIADTGQRSKRSARWCIWADLGEPASMEGADTYSNLFLLATDDMTVEESISYALKGEKVASSSLSASITGKEYSENEEFARSMSRLLAGIGLLATDPTMVIPETLPKDEAKARAATAEELERLAAKARRRGKHGWSFGKDLESMPHYRRPHFGIRWTGAGRAVPKIVPIRGAVVHRQTLSSVPTGRMDETPEPPSEG